ncbi:hypothetical protein T492DRAFT_904916 [Pavlovales sp. CCMP2436]|nr:hypothetical protein T492DRAFT_904916 [Pavlovales sp. CCMP2436]
MSRCLREMASAAALVSEKTNSADLDPTATLRTPDLQPKHYKSPMQLYLPVWHDNPEMIGCAGWKSPSSSLQSLPCDPIEMLDTGTQLGPYHAAKRALCTGAQHLRPKIGMLTACCFPSGDGTLACIVVRGVKGAVRGTYVQKEMTIRQASGHASLAAEGPVLYAGELEVDADGLTRWNNMSGTYRPSADDAGRALLPLEKLWRVVSEIGVFDPPPLDSGSSAQPGAQRMSDLLLLVSDLEWRRSFS